MLPQHMSMSTDLPMHYTCTTRSVLEISLARIAHFIMSDVNLHIVEKLSHIAEAYKSQGAVHKYKAYRTAISTIRAVPTRITSVSDVRGLQGIGKAMEEKIGEILRTGELRQEADVLADPITAALQLFTSVHGIGPVMAHKLVHEQNKRSLSDLDVSQLPAQAQLGVKYFSDARKRIPSEEVKAHHAVIQRVCHEYVDRDVIVSVCGSHRRGLASSGDVDILLSHPASRSSAGCEYVYLSQIASALRKLGIICDTLVEGQAKFMGYCRLPTWAHDCHPACAQLLPEAFSTARRLDIRWFAFDNFASALLYFTGSDLFNIQMRQRALELGFTLSEYGLFQNGGAASEKGKGARVPDLFTEESIFKALNMAFVEPNQRNK